MLMFSSQTLLAAIGVFSILTGCSAAQSDGTAHEASELNKPVIVSLDDALTHSADNKSPAQLEATLALGEFAANAESVRPEVIELLLEHLKAGGDQLVQSAAEVSVRKLGKEMLPSVTRAISSDRLSEQIAACNAIKVIGPGAIELLPQLIKMLESGDALPQRAALYALQGFGGQVFESIDAVAACLESHDFNVQCMACRVLENYGSDALPAEKRLVQILDNGVPSSRGWAAIVLGAIGPTDENDIVPMLIARLSETRAHVEKQRILLGLAHLGREAKRAIPIVTEFMNSRNHRVRPHAAYALYKITDDRELLVNVLSHALGDRNERQDAFDLINRLEGESIFLKAELIDQLTAQEEDVREQAALALGRLGSEATDALPEVKKLLDDPDALVRDAAAHAIAAITASPTADKLGEPKE